MKPFDSTKNPQEWEIDNDLIEQIRRYERETGKSAIWKNYFAGMFLYFNYCEDHPEFLEKKEKSKAKKKGKTKENKEEVDIEKEIENEENLILDVMEDYKTEFGVKKVDTNTKKLKAFF